MTPQEMKYLKRAVELAEAALDAGDEPFGSVLVSASGEVLAEARNRINTLNDQTQHPEIELARWAEQNLMLEQRAAASVYTSGEHCPMCAAAHGWVGLGRIVYVHSARQLGEWLGELGVPDAPIRFLPCGEIVPGINVEGPIPELEARMYALHKRYHQPPNKACQAGRAADRSGKHPNR